MLFTRALDNNRKKIFQKLSSFSNEFVLAGGTAIMFLIHHRQSFDFDCFSEKPLKKNLLSKVSQVFGDNINIQIDTPDLLLFTTAEGVKIDFVNFPYSPLHKLTEKCPIPIFDLKDLASNKAYAIGRRATWRDYVDMFFLLKQYDLSTIIKESKKRFKGEFSEKLYLGQLIYYEDLEITPIQFLQESYTPEQIKNYLQKKVQKYTSSKINGKS